MEKPVGENQNILTDAISNLKVSIRVIYAFFALLLLGLAVACIITFLPGMSDVIESVAQPRGQSVLVALGSAALGIIVGWVVVYIRNVGKNFLGLWGTKKQGGTLFSVLSIRAAEDSNSSNSLNQLAARTNKDREFLNSLNERAEAWPTIYQDSDSVRREKLTRLMRLLSIGFPLVSFLLLISTIVRKYSILGSSVNPFPAVVVFFLSVLMLLGIISIAYFVAQRRIVGIGQHGYESVSEPSLAQFLRGGLVVWPFKVRTGCSYNIYSAFELPFTERVVTCGSEPSEEYVEVELQAAGLKVDGDKQRRLCDKSSVAMLSWNCCFAKPGHYTLNLVVNSVKPPENVRTTLFTKKHEIMASSTRKDLVPTLTTATLSAILIVVNLANILRGFL